MARLVATLHAELRWWLKPALLVAFALDRLGFVELDRSSTWLTKHGVRVKVNTAGE